MASSSSATRQGAWTDAQCERLLGRSQASRLATHGVEKYCRMLLGRPCVFICITYEGDATRHCELFDVAGVPVVPLLCRPAKLAPDCPMDQVVAYGWRDVLLKYVLDESQGWLAQTLFFVLEGDWRPSQTPPAGGWTEQTAMGIVNMLVSAGNAALAKNLGFLWYSWEGRKKEVNYFPHNGLMLTAMTQPTAARLGCLPAGSTSLFVAT